MRRALLLLLPLLTGWTPTIGDAPTGTPTTAANGVRSWKTGIMVDPGSRESARVFFRAIYQASEGASSGWNGNVSAGDPGTTITSFREATALRVNWYRAMAGVPSDVTFKSEYDSKAQRAALMMAANDSLSHNPAKNWKHWSEQGAEGAKNSNLGLGDAGPDAISSYILDAGSNNAEVGHRRWILYPQTRFMGTGDIDKRTDHKASNALWVIDGAASSTRPESRDEYVAWPPRGYVPHHVVFARWSFAHPKGDFTKATVAMTRNGVPQATTIEFNQSGGAGERAIVFVPAGFQADGWSAMPAPTSDVRFDVAISNVIIDGKPRNFVYTVNVFDPARTGPDTVDAAITGAAAAKVGAANPYAFNAVPRADGYRYQESRVVPFAMTEDAEDSGKSWTAKTTGGYDTSNAGKVAKGQATFYLAHSQAASQSLTYNRVLVPSASSTVTFRAKLGHSSPGQIPKLQAKVEGSGAWRDIWVHGKGATPETKFTNYSAPLGEFAGRGVKLRFVYEYHGGTFYSAGSNVGFFFDDVAVTGAEELTSPIEHEVIGTAFTFVPSTEAKYALRVRPRFYGKYFLDYGPVKIVAASGSAPTPPPTTPTPPTPTVPTAVPTTMPTGLPWAFPWPVPILTPPGTPAPPPTPAVLPIPDLEAPLPFPDLGKGLPIPLPFPK